MVMPPKRVLAWYAYTFGCEVFSACALAIFLPITLEHMARETGFIAPELILPCSSSASDEMKDLGTVCKAKIMGIWVDTASFSMYVKSIAVALQAVCIITIGPVADSAYWRKRLLVSFALTGALSAIAFLLFPSRPNNALPVVAALLTIIGNGGYAVGTVCNNAFLPILAREDEGVLGALKEVQASSGDGDELDDGTYHNNAAGGIGQAILRLSVEEEGRLLLPETSLAIPIPDNTTSVEGLTTSNPTKTQYIKLLSLTTSRLSSTATALGFLSGFSILTLLLIPVTLLKGTTSSLCLAIGISGIWWAVFTLLASLGLPGARLLAGVGVSGNEETDDVNGRFDRSVRVSGWRRWSGWLTLGWKRVGEMIRPREIRELRDLYTFLLAWIFLSDGFHTVTYTAILYASSTLQMSPSKVVLLGILVLFFAFISSLFAPTIQKRYNRSNHRLLLYLVLAGEVIPFYACLGLVLPFGGLRTEVEMYLVAIWFGLLYGPFNSYSRAVYAELIPPGHESSFFSLFSLTDKSASFLGPLAVGLIADLTGNIRWGFVFLLIMLAVPIPVLLRVDVDRGREAGKRWVPGRGADVGLR